MCSNYFLVSNMFIMIKIFLLSNYLAISILFIIILFFCLLIFFTIYVIKCPLSYKNMFGHVIISSYMRYIRTSRTGIEPVPVDRPVLRTAAYEKRAVDTVNFFWLPTRASTARVSYMTWLLSTLTTHLAMSCATPTLSLFQLL